MNLKTVLVAVVVSLAALPAAAKVELRKGGSSWAVIEDDGTIRIGGSSVGKIESDGTIRKGGSSIGKIEKDGTLRKSGSSIGSIESGGTIRKGGSSWGSASNCCGDHGSKRSVAAVIVFFSSDFFG